MCNTHYEAVTVKTEKNATNKAMLEIKYPPEKGNQATRQAPEFSIIEEVN